MRFQVVPKVLAPPPPKEVHIVLENIDECQWLWEIIRDYYYVPKDTKRESFLINLKRNLEGAY
jgi:hypothetical protein